LDILPVKKEAKLSASEVPREEVVRICGVGVFLTVCQRRLELLEAEDIRLE